MPPKPQDPQDKTSSDARSPRPTGAGAIDLDKILLPKKDVHPLGTGERINAGALFAQEENATLLSPENPSVIPTSVIPAGGIVLGGGGLPAQAEIGEEKSSGSPQTFSQEVPPSVPNTVPDAPKPKQASSVQPLETYKGDIESAVRDNGTSILSIASAEARRREHVPLPGDAKNKVSSGLVGKLALLAGGALLVLLAGGVLFFVLSRPTSLPPAQAPQTPFITVDSAVSVPVAASSTQGALMQALQTAAAQTQLSLGLIAQLSPVVGTTATPEPMDAQTFLSILAPHIPPALVRNIDPTFLLGVHSYNGNQPFLILSVDSYEQGYAGMLAWEADMQSDLSPLFPYMPQATTTPSFSDQVVDNHDARVATDQNGTVVLLWTFLDRSTLVIATNPSTLSEIIARLQNVPATALQ